MMKNAAEFGGLDGIRLGTQPWIANCPRVFVKDSDIRYERFYGTKTAE
jgi:hypothetical protein